MRVNADPSASFAPPLSDRPDAEYRADLRRRGRPSRAARHHAGLLQPRQCVLPPAGRLRIKLADAITSRARAVNIGGLAATLIPWGTLKAYPDIDDQRSFRVPLYVALALPTISLVAQLVWLVESPWWLVMRNRSAEAQKALEYINKGVPGYSAEEAVRQLEYTFLKRADEQALVREPLLRAPRPSYAHDPLTNPRTPVSRSRPRAPRTWTACAGPTCAGRLSPSSPPSRRT